MAKSQYTDSITGRVVCNIKEINNKIYNIADYRFSASGAKVNNFPSGQAGKYSPSAIRLNDYGSTTEQLPFVPFIYPASTKFTISYWCKPMYISSNTGILSLYGSYNGIYLVLSTGGRKTGFQLVNNGSFSSWYTANNSISTGTWYHLACTIDGKSVKTYLNGTNVVNATLNQDFSYSYGNSHLSFNFNTRSNETYFDDIVVIADQIVWTSNFTVPDYLLLGDVNTDKKTNYKYQIYPNITTSRSTYFDKIYLY